MKKRIRRNYRLARYIVYKETLVDAREQFWSFLGAFAGIGIIAYLQQHSFADSDHLFLIGSFGASSVLIYGAVQSPLAQPRNLIGGHLISAFLGVTIYRFLPDILWVNAPLSVGLSIICMQMTKTLHPPGGATALIAVIGSEKIKSMGYYFLLFPVLSGIVVLLLVALICNNMTPYRRYPTDGRFSKTIKKVIHPGTRLMKHFRSKPLHK